MKGFVKDNEGKPIKGATIGIGDRRHDIKTEKDGDYWRLLVPGTYDITVRAKGFKPVIRSVEVSPGFPTILNFTMQLKQLDGLEETLGHVNRVRFPSFFVECCKRYFCHDNNLITKALRFYLPTKVCI